MSKKIAGAIAFVLIAVLASANFANVPFLPKQDHSDQYTMTPAPPKSEDVPPKQS